jgi:hypothetical protein
MFRRPSGDHADREHVDGPELVGLAQLHARLCVFPFVPFSSFPDQSYAVVLGLATTGAVTQVVKVATPFPAPTI